MTNTDPAAELELYYHVGDPDPTPEEGPSCSAEHEGWGCTWPPNHYPLPHVAGGAFATGNRIMAVWPIA